MSRKDSALPGRDAQEKKCLTPGCKGIFGAKGVGKGKSGGRGLCRGCHLAASSLVRRGKTTWEEMEQLGLAIPKTRSRVEEALYRKRKIAEQKADPLPEYPAKELNEHP